MSDTVITVENLSKKYLVGHRNQARHSYTSLREVIGRRVRTVARKALDVARGRQVVQGDEVEEFWALREVSFEVKRGEVLGIIGRNGAGKSTLLKILSRITEPTGGRVVLRGRVASLLEVGTGFHPELTGRENIFLNGAILGMTRSEIRTKFDEIVAFAQVERFLDTPVKHYSSGMHVRLAFAVAAHLEPEILVVDEVLAVGDTEFQRKCLGKMEEVSRREGRTVLFVSHNLASLASLCKRGIVLDTGKKLLDGSVGEAIRCYCATARGPQIFLDQARLAHAPQIQILSLELLDSNCRATSHVLSGAAVIFRVRLRCSTSTVNMSIVLLISNLSGSTLAKFETNPRELPIFRKRGDEFIDCSIASLPLMPGEYHISLGVASHGEQFIVLHHNVEMLIVRSGIDADTRMSDYPEGPVWAKNSWIRGNKHWLPLSQVHDQKSQEINYEKEER